MQTTREACSARKAPAKELLLLVVIETSSFRRRFCEGALPSSSTHHLL